MLLDLLGEMERTRHGFEPYEIELIKWMAEGKKGDPPSDAASDTMARYFPGEGTLFGTVYNTVVNECLGSGLPLEKLWGDDKFEAISVAKKVQGVFNRLRFDKRFGAGHPIPVYLLPEGTPELIQSEHEWLTEAFEERDFVPIDAVLGEQDPTQENIRPARPETKEAVLEDTAFSDLIVGRDIDSGLTFLVFGRAALEHYQTHEQDGFVFGDCYSIDLKGTDDLAHLLGMVESVHGLHECILPEVYE